VEGARWEEGEMGGERKWRVKNDNTRRGLAVRGGDLRGLGRRSYGCNVGKGSRRRDIQGTYRGNLEQSGLRC